MLSATCTFERHIYIIKHEHERPPPCISLSRRRMATPACEDSLRTISRQKQHGLPTSRRQEWAAAVAMTVQVTLYSSVTRHRKHGRCERLVVKGLTRDATNCHYNLLCQGICM